MREQSKLQVNSILIKEWMNLLYLVLKFKITHNQLLYCIFKEYIISKKNAFKISSIDDKKWKFIFNHDNIPEI